MKIQLWEAVTSVQVSFSLCEIFLTIPFDKEFFWITYNIV